MKEKLMKKAHKGDVSSPNSDEMRAEYDFDYQQARPNRFAGKAKDPRLVVVLDPDIAQVFTTPESVNNVLRALITTMPPFSKQKRVVD
jgi:hypothetical protein